VSVLCCVAHTDVVAIRARSKAWDFFVSYTQADRGWAEWIAWELESAGFAVVIQAWDMQPGDNWVHRVDEACELAAHTVAVVSGSYLRSEWGRVEQLAAIWRDPLGKHRKLIPVRVSDCALPGLLGSISVIDVFDADEATARERLVAAARSARGHWRGKPARRPSFPSTAPGAGIEARRFPGQPPAVWQVPFPRNPGFTGRDRELAVLRGRLASGQETAAAVPQVVHGLGGVGKTQLVLEYAYRYASDYDLIWWLPAEQPSLMTASLQI
jgi:hypothetical protein